MINQDWLPAETMPAGPHEDLVARFWKEAALALGIETAVLTAGRADSAVIPAPWTYGLDRAGNSELVELTVTGRKTATSSAYLDYLEEGGQLPHSGEISIMCDFDGCPRALLEITAVETCLFNDVTAEHAAAEGEGDCSLEYWRTAHTQFFMDQAAERGETLDLAEIGQELVVLEQFRVLYTVDEAWNQQQLLELAQRRGTGRTSG